MVKSAVKCVLFIIGVIACCWFASDSRAEDRLHEIIQQHESHILRLRTARVSWSVKFQNATSDGEKFETILTPEFQATTSWSRHQKPSYETWDGKSLVQIGGYDPKTTDLEDPRTRFMTANLFGQDRPTRYMFDWRSGRSYRLLATDRDITFAELCGRSATTPKISQHGKLTRVEIDHPGVEAGNSGVPGIPAGTPVTIDFDPEHGDYVQRHETTLQLNADTRLTQISEVLAFEEPVEGVFVPTKVRLTGTFNGEPGFEAETTFSYSNVNQPLIPKPARFLPEMLVIEYGSAKNSEPVGFYVVDDDLSLGPQYASIAVAAAVQKHRAGLIDDDQLESQLAILSAVPGSGTVAPPIAAADVISGQKRTISLEGQVTAIEFWSTTCAACQYSMPQYDEIAAEAKKKWPDMVQFVSISLNDDDNESVREHMRTKGWSHTIALMDIPSEIEPETTGVYPGTLSASYVVSSLPTLLIVDRSGKIVFRGHPNQCDLAAEIESLLIPK